MVAHTSPALNRLLDPLAECLTDESADRVARFTIDPGVQERLDELAAKSNAGTLTDAERAEYLDFVEAIDLVSLLQSKARNARDRRVSA